jgi:DNA anti-recombination protein RmuC
VQRIVDAQVHEEGQKVEEAMQARMQQLREQRRQQLEERKKELLKQQESLTGFQISKLKDQYERELNDLEAAIRREEAQ